ncbi:PREDICTED: dnaJ homolog subfamily C member 25 homolog [Nicrophorus vespilloides]|uniref:DnaJ homolog subfamily C member 25 homolog n=1 Tax=Nicrophorus vespilloides TaxID=110193 RepID=A0ABM1NCI1_NICVS|nr:PREDICTED: dnaJ homolog subfamily C member 25 homolog [Nicrophorus vespilloides]
MILRFLSISLVLIIVSSLCEAQLLEGLYCGKSNCYDVIGVPRDASKSEIAKNYRKLARQFHPDLHREVEAKAIAEEQFKTIATAYEILKDDESRADYDYMLDNPDAYYAHYYRYYRRRVAPKVDVRVVIITTITVISLVQYFGARQRYYSAIKYFITVPKYRNKALDIAKADGLLVVDKKSKKSKSEIKEETEKIIQSVIEDKMDIKGAYAKPSVYDVLWIQLVFSPYTISKWIYLRMMYFVKFTFLKQEYTLEYKLYLIRKYLKMGQHQFDSIEDHQKQDYLHQELWDKEKFDIWKKQEEEDMKIQMAESNRYKQYRRFMKKNGIPRMTFDDS